MASTGKQVKRDSKKLQEMFMTIAGDIQGHTQHMVRFDLLLMLVQKWGYDSLIKPIEEERDEWTRRF